MLHLLHYLVACGQDIIQFLIVALGWVVGEKFHQPSEHIRRGSESVFIRLYIIVGRTLYNMAAMHNNQLF